MGRKKLDSLTISIIILAVFAVVVSFLNTSRANVSAEAEKPALPLQLSDWKLLRDVVIPEDILAVLGTKAASLGEYANALGEKVNLYILKSSGRRSTIHPPEYCYLGSGKNELLKKGKFPMNIDDKQTIKVNYMFIQIEGGFQTVVYFYTANELITNNYYKQQLFFLLKRLKSAEVQGSLIRISKFSKNNDFLAEINSLQPIVKSIVNTLTY
ncbi:MAG: exosortase C-terminal domain/associated protein EpsI [Candidatus Omnitrophota bacterium]